MAIFFRKHLTFAPAHFAQFNIYNFRILIVHRRRVVFFFRIIIVGLFMFDDLFFCPTIGSDLQLNVRIHVCVCMCVNRIRHNLLLVFVSIH